MLDRTVWKKLCHLKAVNDRTFQRRKTFVANLILQSELVIFSFLFGTRPYWKYYIVAVITVFTCFGHSLIHCLKVGRQWVFFTLKDVGQKIAIAFGKIVPKVTENSWYLEICQNTRSTRKHKTIDLWISLFTIVPP